MARASRPGVTKECSPTPTGSLARPPATIRGLDPSLPQAAARMPIVSDGLGVGSPTEIEEPWGV